MKPLLLLSAFVVLAVAAIIFVTQFESESSKTQENSDGLFSEGSTKTVNSGNSPKRRTHERLSIIKSAMSNSNLEKERGSLRFETAEENMIRRLEYLASVLAEEPRDLPFEREILDRMSETIRKHDLESTRVIDVLCGETMCRVEFVHEDLHGHAELVNSGVFEEGPWGYEGAGREYQREGSSFTELIFGKAGKKLPVIPEEVKERKYTEVL